VRVDERAQSWLRRSCTRGCACCPAPVMLPVERDHDRAAVPGAAQSSTDCDGDASAACLQAGRGGPAARHRSHAAPAPRLAAAGPQLVSTPARRLLGSSYIKK